MASKKPCSVCRRWFRPDPRVGARHRACSEACSRERRQKTQAAWRRRNPDYFVARRLTERSREKRRDPPRVSGLWRRVPWDLVQSEFGTEGADLIGVVARVGQQVTQSEIGRYLVDKKSLTSRLPSKGPQSEMVAEPG